MMPCKFTTKSGTAASLDLDAVFDVVEGPSGRHPNWTALIIYEPTSNVLVELRDAPQDVRGNSASEAEEVDDAYVQNHFGLSEHELASLRAHPKRWRMQRRA